MSGIELPASWCLTSVGEVASELISGSGFPKEHQGGTTGDYPFAKVGDISRLYRSGGKLMHAADHYISEATRSALKARLFPKGSLVFPKIGEALKGNYRVITTRPMLFDNNVMGVVPDDRIVEATYLFYFLTTQDFGRFAVATAVPSVRGGDIASISLGLPPRAEQRRIVSKIEALFSELNKGLENLATVRAQLKAYRQAVLKHAFQGKLTAQWRDKNSGKVESGKRLIARIKEERELHYQAKISAWNTAPHKNGGKPRPPKTFEPLKSQEREQLPALPDSWAWEKLGWMTCGVEYGTGAKSLESGSVPVLRMGNIQNAKFDWSDLVYTSDENEILKYTLKTGDVLFNRTNSPELVGKTSIYRGERPALFAGYLIRINQIPSIVDSQYLNLFLNSHIARQQGNRVKTDGVNQSNMNGEKLSNYAFPYCSLAEQREIVKILEEKLSIIDQLEKETEQQIKKSEVLRQSILRRAFFGLLVEQYPSDEPASVLLGRIRAEKEHTSSDGKRNSKNRKKEAA
jgi:type I restriction enzyme S subunit